MNDEKTRCPWLPTRFDLYREYHDTEWGVPSRDPHHLFEMICLEGAQAGLSWWTVLQKRARYREVFNRFDPTKCAAMTDDELDALVHDAGIIRHRGKIASVRQNARAWLLLENPVDWLWNFAADEPAKSRPQALADYPTRTAASDALSKALRKAGFNFVGSTTMYAFMQAVGMVDDHAENCFLAKEKS